MKTFLALLIITASITFCSFAQSENESTDSVGVGKVESGNFYIGESRLFSIDTPDTLDAAIVKFKTSKDTASANFKILTKANGDTVKATLTAGATVIMEPKDVVGLKKFFKIVQTDTAAATRVYSIRTGKY